jgi:hypothetical protein
MLSASSSSAGFFHFLFKQTQGMDRFVWILHCCTVCQDSLWGHSAEPTVPSPPQSASQASMSQQLFHPRSPNLNEAKRKKKE